MIDVRNCRSLLGAVLIPAFALAADPGVTKDEVKLGTTVPMSGPVAFYGEMSKGARAYFNKINDEGGVNGRKIKVVVEDDAYNPAKTVPLTRKLVEQEKIFAFYQALGFPHTSVAKYLAQKGVPSFFVSDGSKVWDEYPNVIRGNVPWVMDGKFLGEYVAKKFPGKTVGFLYERSNLGKEGLEGAKAALQGKVKMGPEESYDPGAPNVDAQTLNLMNGKVDVVIANAVPPAVIGAVKLATQKQWKPTWVVSYVNCDPVMVALGGQAMEGVISATLFKLPTDNDPAVKEHQALLDKYFPGTKMSPVTVYGQANAELMVETLRKAGPNLTRAGALKAAKSLKDFKCSLCVFPTNTSDTDRAPFEDLRMMRIKNGQWVELKD